MVQGGNAAGPRADQVVERELVGADVGIAVRGAADGAGPAQPLADDLGAVVVLVEVVVADEAPGAVVDLDLHHA